MYTYLQTFFGACVLAFSLLLVVFFGVTPSLAASQKLRIVYANDNLGELTPCGSCNVRYKKGGMAKKQGFVKSQADGPPLLLLDAGNQLFPGSSLSADGGRARAARIVARGVAAANREIGIKIAGIGMNDLAAGPDFLRELAEDDCIWLSANLVGEDKDKPLFSAYTTVQLGELTVGIMALTWPEGRMGASRGYRILPWEQVLPALVAELRPRVGMLVLLSNNSRTDNERIATLCPEIDLIFQAGFARGNMEPFAVGQTLITQTEIRGRYLGVLDIEWSGRGVWRGSNPQETAAGQGDGPHDGPQYSQRFVRMDYAVQDDPNMTDKMGAVEREAREAQKLPSQLDGEKSGK